MSPFQARVLRDIHHFGRSTRGPGTSATIDILVEAKLVIPPFLTDGLHILTDAGTREVARLLPYDPCCQDCEGTGQRDSGGSYPWGEPIWLACDCNHEES